MRLMTLTGSQKRGEMFSVNIDKIAAITEYKSENFPEWKSAIHFSAQENDYLCCCETREEVVSIIRETLHT